MPKFSLPELITLALFLLTTALLWFAHRAKSFSVRRATACASIVSGALTGYALFACYTGEADRWFDLSRQQAPGGGGTTRLTAAGGGGDGKVVVAARQGAKKGGASGEPDGDDRGDGGGEIEADGARAGGGSGSSRGLVYAALFGRKPDVPAKDAPFRDCPECPEMVPIPAGFAPLGADGRDADAGMAERPQRVAKVDRPMAIGRYEVTVAEYRAFLSATTRTDATCGGASHAASREPVQCVSWREARAYVSWLGDRTGQRYRLPTAAEWEYAARAGTGTRYPLGDALKPGAANVGGSEAGPVTVGSHPANRFGLRDMTGNVAELVSDCWIESLVITHRRRAGIPRPDCRQRMLKDAAWFEAEALARVSARRPIAPDVATPGVGLRVARDMR